MNSFALYRLPFAKQYVEIEQLDGSPEVVGDIASLSGKRGFVFAPFQISKECPLLLIRPDRMEIYPISELSRHKRDYIRPLLIGEHSHRDSYHDDFSQSMERLKNGDFQKVVLARMNRLAVSNPYDIKMLFARACERYPRMMIVLVHTPQSGTWLVASPEILLESTGNLWRTIALAGTMPYVDIKDNPEEARYPQLTWSTKNIQEQRYVASYISECLEHRVGRFSEDGPYSVRAGNLVHLRTDFCFENYDQGHIGELLTALHPTPAVCGLPKAATLQFINDRESLERKYYSGFLGPLGLNGENHLYVTLRCMSISDNSYSLYAGGGLLRDSVEETEWAETEEKMKTLRDVVL